MRPVLLIFLGVFLVSTIAGPLLDQIHVISGTLSYSDPWLLGQAWWVGPQFGLAFAGIAVTTLLIQRWFGTPSPRPTPPVRIGQQLAWFVAAYLTTGLLHQQPWLVLGLLSIGLLIRTAYERPDVATVRIFVLLALLGTTYEIALSAIPGTFTYSVGGLLHAPIWLPLLYAHGAPLVRTFMKNAVRLVTPPAAPTHV